MAQTDQGPRPARPSGFWVFAAVLAVLFMGAGAPTPLYVVYEREYDFSAIVLTLVFAVYVVALLAAFVLAGRLSDHIGRRPVLLLALPINIAAALVFLVADATVWLLIARTVQGVAVGLATAALSASLLDTEPEGHRGRGAVVSSSAPLAGLAVGALGSAVLVQLGPDPTRLVFWVLTAALVASTIAVALTPEPAPAHGQWRAALRPQVSVPRAIRPTFAAVAPCMIATWALGGLYLSLGPSLTRMLTGSSSYVVGALVVVALVGTGATTGALTYAIAPERRMVGGTLLVVAGVVVTGLAIATRSTVLLFAGSTVAGLGFGPSFAGVFALITNRAEAHERAGLISAVYVVSYSAFSIPAVLAGLASTEWGLRPTALVYATAVVLLATAALVAYRRVAGRTPAVA
ncbi:MAG: MFS transporter [Solirubrobacteraceae bacterium]